MKEQIIAFLKDEEGLTAVEYAIAGALVVGGLVTAFQGLGNAVLARIGQLTNAVNGVAAGGGGG